jgi:putative permease|tara:strand:- start:2979 stop:4055 length:1077 start_codon:yes stop_codon:yes gene_type:complete
MLDVMRGWLDRYLSDEEAVLFSMLLLLVFIVILTLGNLLAPVLTGLVLAFVMQGLITYLVSLRVPNSVAVPVTFFTFLGIFFAFFLFVIPRVWRQMTNLFNELPNMVEKGQALLELLPESFPDLITSEKVATWVDMLGAEVAQFGQWLVSYSLSQLPLLMSILVYTLLVPILVFFFLKDKDLLLNWFLSFLPKEKPLMNKIGREMGEQMANYMRGKVIEILIAGSATYILFVIVGLNYAALLGFLVGLSVIIPYLGVAVVTIPVVLIAYSQWGWSGQLLIVMLLYGVIQALDGLILVPKLFSEVVNLHPIAIITAVLVFGGLWGLWGVFFAIPLATLIKAIMTAWPKHTSQEEAAAES